MAILTQDHLDLQKTTRAFAEAEIAPLSREIDMTRGEIPESLVRKMAELGVFGINISAKYGGSGLDAISACIVTEELCKANLAMGSVIHRNMLCGHILERYGTEEQKQRWLPGMADGSIMTATAGTEPEAGSDAANVQTRARLDGGHYTINGTKQWCTFANRANLIFVYARTSNEHKHKGISLFVVEKEPGDDFVPPGLTGSWLPTVGYQGMHSFMLNFDDFEVPAGNLLGGEEGHGFYQLMSAYEIGRITLAFRCTGVAQAAYEAAVTYTQQREQFGQPISDFQAVRFRLADMATEIEAARALGYSAAMLFDDGKPAAGPAGMAKLFAAEMVLRVTWGALYLHGGNGYALESDVNRYWRDAALLPIGEGTSDIQREIIAKAILGRKVGQPSAGAPRR
jgi:alkylation response protein AidB-like acyl-CoA dehydrogenase